MDEGYKEVDFEKYCETCEYKDLEDIHEPCNGCLESPMNLHSCKPINYKQKKTKKSEKE